MSVRIIAAIAGDKVHQQKSVNVITEADPLHQFKTHTQEASDTKGRTPVHQLAPTGTKGLPTIRVPGFTGPS
jgi:hypothetical protein